MVVIHSPRMPCLALALFLRKILGPCKKQKSRRSSIPQPSSPLFFGRQEGTGDIGCVGTSSGRKLQK